MKVALVHEFLTQFGGAERVLTAFHEIFPEAPVFTLMYDRERTAGKFDGWDIRTSFLQKITPPLFPPLIKGGKEGGYKWLLPLMSKAIESFELNSYELVLSDSSAFAKGIRVQKPTIHICYCHTPTRYLWQEMEYYVSSIKYHGLIKLAAKLYLKNYLKHWDYQAAQRPDFFIANSRTVQERIKKYYNRESEVIYPPVDTEFFTPSDYDVIARFAAADQSNPNDGEIASSALGRLAMTARTYFLTASRLEPYKKIGLVVEAFNQLGLPLKVAGDGTEAKSLKLKAKSNIEFLGRVSDEQLRELYRGAKAFTFPSLEDAGIMILESLACGTPVIAYAKGGASEFIRDGENGVLMREQSFDQLFSIGKRWSMYKFDPQKLREFALPFDKRVFKERILKFVGEHTP